MGLHATGDLSRELGFETVRATGIDGVCAEPIVALELAALMLEARRCDRVINNDGGTYARYA